MDVDSSRVTKFKAVNGAWVKVSTKYEHLQKGYTVEFKTNVAGYASLLQFEYSDTFLVYAGNPGQECLTREVRNTNRTYGQLSLVWSCNNAYGVPVLQSSSKTLKGGLRENKTYTVTAWDNQTPLYANRDWLEGSSDEEGSGEDGSEENE